jgi:hypothetical protein
LYTNERIKFVNKSSFDLKRVKGTPAPLIISCNTYQTVSYLPCEYLIDAEIYFAPPLLSCGLYDIFKGFQSYSNSKQRNGK